MDRRLRSDTKSFISPLRLHGLVYLTLQFSQNLKVGELGVKTGQGRKPARLEDTVGLLPGFG